MIGPFRISATAVAIAVLALGQVAVAPSQAAVSAPSAAATALAPASSDAVAPSAAAASAYVYRTFRTPSGNIRCGAWRTSGKWGMRCDVYEHFWVAPAGSCPDFGDYGSSVGMSGRGWPGFICVSDAMDDGPVLRYGRTWDVGPFTCKSRFNGLKCWNGRGHGWFLSRDSYRLY